jgi:peptidoglycan/xylan/chitin deacetylase (PgdA/CDA1 family)
LAHRVVGRASRAGRTLIHTATENSAVILMYHRINRAVSGSDNLTVSPERFREQMRALRELFDPVELRELEDSGSYLRGPRRERRVAVTFDDGYADTLTDALPALRESGIPATVFVATGWLGRADEFWWDELRHLMVDGLASLPGLRALPERVFPSARVPGRQPEELFRELWPALRDAGSEVIDPVLRELRSFANKSPSGRASYRALTVDELCALAADRLIEIGAHTVSHGCLGTLSRDEQYREIRDSRDFLEARLRRPVSSFAYPYGDTGTFSEHTQEIVRELGFSVAVSTLDGVVTSESPRYALPRMMVRDWGAEEFVARLSRYFWLA